MGEAYNALLNKLKNTEVLFRELEEAKDAVIEEYTQSKQKLKKLQDQVRVAESSPVIHAFLTNNLRKDEVLPPITSDKPSSLDPPSREPPEASLSV